MAANEHVDLATSGADRTAEAARRRPRNPPRTDAKAAAVHAARLPRRRNLRRADRADRPRRAAVDDRRPDGDTAFRTSTTCDLDHRDPLVIAVNHRLHDLTGIPLEYGEPMQGQRYDVGQEFKAHTDYFDRHGSDWETYCAIPGQRSWTLMIYLNEPGAGGATRFCDWQDASARDGQAARVEQCPHRRPRQS